MEEMNRKPNHNILELTVSEVSQKLKRTVEDAFGHVRIRGEITGFRGPHSSGHCYFSLKDERARIEAVIWRGVASRMKYLPEEGMEIIATGKLTTYPGASKYQIIIEKLEPAGVGALMALLEERRRKLAAEGLFAEERKQLLPFLPAVIGVVTSPTGAVIRDVLHRIRDRFPLHVIVWPVRVQGESSSSEVAAAITGFNQIGAGDPIPRPDIIIVARGGGSLEDLWGFNDEAVVRAAAQSDIPLVSAVGHETDWTLIDHAADVRAPTPTGAAELSVPVKAELIATIADLSARLTQSVRRGLDQRASLTRAVTRALPSSDNLLAMPSRRFDEIANRLVRALGGLAVVKRARLERVSHRLSGRALSQAITRSLKRLDELAARCQVSLANQVRVRGERLNIVVARSGPERLTRQIRQLCERMTNSHSYFRRAFDLGLQNQHQRSGRSARLLQSLGYKQVLERGYAVVRSQGGPPLRTALALTPGAALSVELHDGKFDAVAGTTEAPLPQKPKAQPRRVRKPGDQGDLF